MAQQVTYEKIKAKGVTSVSLPIRDTLVAPHGDEAVGLSKRWELEIRPTNIWEMGGWRLVPKTGVRWEIETTATRSRDLNSPDIGLKHFQGGDICCMLAK